MIFSILKSRVCACRFVAVSVRVRTHNTRSFTHACTHSYTHYYAYTYIHTKGTINYNVANKCWGITSSMGFGLYITLPFLSKFFALAIYFKGTGGISEQPPSVDQDEFSFIEPTMDQCLSESPWALLRSFRVVAMKLASRTSMLDQMKMQIEEKVKSSKAYTDFDTVYLQQMKLEELASEVFVTASSVSAMPVLSGPRRRKGTKRSTQSRTRKRLGSLESLPSSSPKLRNRKSANVDRRRERLTDDKIVYDMDMVHTGRTKTRSYTEGDIFIEGTVEVSAAATSTSASNENRRIGQTRRTLLETGGHGNGDADSDSFSPAPSAHKGSSTSSKSSVENESPVDDGTDLGRGGGRAMGVLDKVITPVRMSVKPMLLKMIKYTWHVRSYLLLTQQDPNPPLPPSAATDTTTPPADFDAGAPAKLGFGENADMIDRVYTQQTGKCLHRMGRHKNVNALSKGWNKGMCMYVYACVYVCVSLCLSSHDESKYF